MTKAISILIGLILFSGTWGTSFGQKAPFAPSLLVKIDNDYFNINIRGTDRYYSDGFFLGFSSQVRKRNILDRLMLTASKDAFRVRYLTVSQQLYTPHHIGNPNLQVGDYPYAALLALRYGNRTIMDDYAFYSQLTLGVQGPIALGEEVQKPLHQKVFHSNSPLGWKHQLPNDIAICYTFNFQKRLYDTQRIELNGYGEVNLGTLYNNLSAGAIFKVGLFSSSYAPQAWLFARDRQQVKRQIYLCLTPYIKMVQSNSLLEGGPLKTAGGAWGTPTAHYYHIDRSELERLIFGYSWMVKYVGTHVSVAYHQNFYSAEIKGLNGHMYGTITFEVKL